MGGNKRKETGEKGIVRRVRRVSRSEETEKPVKDGERKLVSQKARQEYIP